MPKNVITLLNEHGTPVATMSADNFRATLDAADPFTEQRIIEVTDEIEAKYNATLLASLEVLGDTASDAEIRQALANAATEAGIVPLLRAKLEKTVTDQLTQILRPLAESLTKEAVGDGKELNAFLNGILAGVQATIVHQIKQQRQANT